MGTELRRTSIKSLKSRRSSASLDFKSRIKYPTNKDEDDVEIKDAFTTFHFTNEIYGESEEADTVFIFPRNWPEWSDYELNTEAWKNEDIESNQLDYYHDPERVLLPHTQMRILDCWKRPKDAFQSPCILYDDTAKSIDIISANKHLLNSRCMRWVISSIAMVQKLAEDTPYPTEGENPQYTPNGGIPWRPWHHIYSLCKAGKVPHKPLINPSGKYIIRLYYLGCWRKIVVDDKLPFDSKGNMLLPASTIIGELWPMLLSKALLKIASHTWNKLEDPTGFHPISCLTGWMCEEFTDLEFDNFQLWKLINGILEEVEGEELVKEEPKVEPPPVSPKKAKKKPDISPKKATKGMKDKTELPELVKKPPKPTEILAVLSYWSEKYDATEVVQQIFPIKDTSQQIINVSANEKLKTMSFPVLFQGYKEKLNRRTKKEIDNDYPWKKKLQQLEFEKQNYAPECYMNAYSHFFGMVEETATAHEAEVSESPPVEDSGKASKGKDKKGKNDKKEKKEKKVADNKKSDKGKGSAAVKNPVNLENMMVNTGKWISFNSLTSLLQGIILIHKPALFTSHIQKPDFSRLLSPKISNTSDNLDDIDEESELCSEFGAEEKSFICLDSAEEINFILGLYMLPTPTKLDENYSTAFDLMLNACEGRDEEYFNYNSSPHMCDAHITCGRKHKAVNQPLNNSDKNLEKWVEYNDDLIYELEGDNEQYTLNDHLFLDKDALVVEISVDENGNDNSEDAEWECDEYELKLYKVGEVMKKRCEDAHCKSFDVHRHMPSSLHSNSLQQSFCEKKSIFHKLSKAEPQITDFLFSNQLKSSKKEHLKSFEDIETFYGHPTMSHKPQSLRTSTYLSIEIFRWDDSNAGHPEMQFHILNGETIHFVLPPGRHIFILIIRSASFYSLHLLSNVRIFHTVSKSDLFTIMKDDCARLAYYESSYAFTNFKVSKKLPSLHPIGLINLRYCFWEKAFKESIKRIVKENISSENLDDVYWALKVVFFDVSFKKDDDKLHIAFSDDNTGSIFQRKESVLKRKMTQEYRVEEAAAIKIQRFFKGILNRKLFLCLLKDKELISRNLNHLINLLKSKNDINIMRTMMNEVPILRNIYGLSQDLGNEINVYEWKGLTLEVNNGSWIPLVRYVFGWKSEEEIMSSIFLTCTLDNWVMTIIDNDSGMEIQRINNFCIPNLYKANEKGYTLFAYGLERQHWWSTVPWKVNQIVPRSSPPLLICHNGMMSSEAEKIPKLRADTLAGYYIPNLQKRICRFIIKVKECCQISLCFNTSNMQVEFKFKVIDEKMEIIIDQEIEGILVIPSMFLEGSAEDEEYKVYTGEVILMNTWPLSDYQKKYAENQWIKDVAYFQASTGSLSSDMPKNLQRQTSSSSFAVDKSPRKSLMETKLKLSEPFIEPVSTPESYPATWRLEILLNSPQEVILEEIKETGDRLRNMKREWEETDPGILQKTFELYQTHESKSFTECFGYSKKRPTKFKCELPLFEEFQEKESEDETLGEKKSQVSPTRDHRASSVQRRSIRPKKKKKEHESIREDNHTTSTVTTNATLSEKESTSDEDIEADGSENSSESSTSETQLELQSEHLIGHCCDISTSDIVGFRGMWDDVKSTINFNFTLKSLVSAKEHEGKNDELEAKRKSTELSLYDIIYQDRSECDLWRGYLSKKNSLSDGTGDNLLRKQSTSSGLRKLSFNAEQTAAARSVVETLFQIHEKYEEEDTQEDLYKSYYIDNSDTTSSSSSDESCSLSQYKLRVMTVDDWVNIQSKLVHKQERFKKKLFKIFNEVESLVRAPFEGHLEKWNIYLANSWRSSEEAFTETENSLDAYRRAKKKLEIIRKQKIKDDMNIIMKLKGGKAKKGNKAKKEKPQKEKRTKEKPLVDKSKGSSANEEEEETEGKKRTVKKTKKTK